MANQYIIQQGIPWPTWALPLSAVSTETMEALCVRSIRLLQWWESDISRAPLCPSRCILRPENSVTWLSICLSRWLVVQLSGRVLELWDLEDDLQTRPQACFDGIDGIINGESIVHDGPENCTLVISTRSDLAYAFELQLSRPGMLTSNPHVRLTRSWTGYSKLLDATHSLWAFARTCTNQAATILHCPSGRSVRLLGTEDDELHNLPGAIQIRHRDIAVARGHSLDIYNLDSVMSALSPETEATTVGTIKPFQTLAYPHAWTGSGLTFIPNRPPWLRPESSREGNIHLSLTEDDIGYSVGLVAHKEEAMGTGGISYKFEQPYYLFGPQNHWTVAVCLGKSARRAVSVSATPERAFLCGISIPSDGDPLEDYTPYMDRIVTRWRIPHGEKDFTRYLGFDEPSGISAIAMASGHLWIMDPNASPLESVDPFSPVDLIRPDPAWPSSHPTPWLRGVTKSLIQDEDMEDSPRWTSSVEKFFPDKNKPDCFGGATWFINEALHLRGTAEVFLFTIPQSCPYPLTELIRLGERIVVVRRHEGTGCHEAWVLNAGSTVESVKAHLQAGGRIPQLHKTKLAVDELPTRRYALWRHRTEPSNELHL
ncbi:hypothetical protein M407DRAFT_23012 [Tulasnella calospora MUT 4182]|uniref:Uncharacterized protein n=1 Tax=Tulasnella calospora MUT 4182 TaxID=1051891 RepID=A0A0C3L1S1_9AGAM|nr:hypothetical protein M407DRAFT_23012 [Tulasnella calospora MUT 4182]